MVLGEHAVHYWGARLDPPDDGPGQIRSEVFPAAEVPALLLFRVGIAHTERRQDSSR